MCSCQNAYQRAVEKRNIYVIEYFPVWTQGWYADTERILVWQARENKTSRVTKRSMRFQRLHVAVECHLNNLIIFRTDQIIIKHIENESELFES